MNRDSFATAATPSMQSHESPHAQVKDEERDEVYFDEFCNMLDALEEREKREKKEREALLIREALRHHACVVYYRVLPSKTAPRATR